MLAATKLGLTLIVLPLGDSITDGVPTTDGYRAYLARELAAAGIGVDYVGSLRSPAGAHEGWSGYTAAELLPPLRGALDRFHPQVVLLHIGTNDLGLGVGAARAAEDVRKLLELIDERSRRGASQGKAPIRVFLAKIIGRNLFAAGERDDELLTYNARLAEVAAARRKAGQPVELVDMHAAVDPRRDLDDALHPNQQGYQKIARAWAQALKKAYPSPSSPPSRPRSAGR